LALSGLGLGLLLLSSLPSPISSEASSLTSTLIRARARVSTPNIIAVIAMGSVVLSRPVDTVGVEIDVSAEWLALTPRCTAWSPGQSN